MNNNTLSICDQEIQPGESISLALPLPEVFSCANLYMPIQVINGKKPGPCVLIIAAMHGNELNGTEIINRLSSIKRLNKLEGSIIAIPIFNVYAFLNKSRHLPGNNSLEKSFPGSKKGTLAERVTNLFIQKIFSLADYCIDLQTGFNNYTNFPQLYTDTNNTDYSELAKAFGSPIVSNLTCEEGMLSAYAKKKNTPYFIYEAGEASRFNETAIKTGVKGVVNFLESLKMITKKTSLTNKNSNTLFVEKNIWVRASTSGISYSSKKLGQHIQQGEEIAVIKDPFGASEAQPIYCPEDSVIVGKNNMPLVREGEGLFQLATFKKGKQAASSLTDWKENTITNNE